MKSAIGKKLCEEIKNEDIKPNIKHISKYSKIDSLENYIINKYLIEDENV